MRLKASEKLKPCPFCGGSADMHHRSLKFRGKEKNYYLVYCDECGAQVDSKETEKEAIAAWNRRA